MDREDFKYRWKLNKRIIAAFCGVVLIAILGERFFSAKNRSTNLASWFEGATDVRLSQLKLETYGSQILLTKTRWLTEINSAVKTKVIATGPRGVKCNALVQINGKWCGEVEISCHASSRKITIGLPTTMFSARPEFVYAEFEVSADCAQALHQAIDGAYNLVE